ncbi:metallo-beta-lactamase superfamily protein [Grosmannia clavigera kw1407]|uniref:Metallo-beta-lactamase superfamily protein n=1 Tax=Grosmannia clavigera (strain kw1407 / UAMH 11150) TaxID=655863 RepID=F0XLB6_GROCL|nr:metallo-beta-lactamase superfamily protein [Grosmannia clavigera kw1407]EFX01249.1 metallo-beta-lactamase superfamily protein [Grosmannia clavigera kw1407]
MSMLQRQVCRQQPFAARRLGLSLVTATRAHFRTSSAARQSTLMTRLAPLQLTYRTLSSPSTLLNSASFASAAGVTKEPSIHNVFEPVTGTWQYVVADPATLQAVIMDPVLDYDPVSQAVTTEAADALLAFVREKSYQICHILETHAHADHLTAASYLQSRLAEKQGHKPRIGIGKRITQVQTLFGKRYGVPAEEYGAVFDTLFEDDETFAIGNLQAKAVHLPGHTPDHVGYMIGDNVFCGDLLFHADIGTARCDFPGGNPSQLFHSGRKLLALPGHVKIWTGHDYPPEDRRDAVACLTVDEHKAQNKHLSGGVTEEVYVTLRRAKDETMAAPRLLHQSLQVNIRGGRLPKPTSEGLRLLHLPLKPNGTEW